MMTLACHCGQVRLAVARRPDHINECNCSLCAKSGAKWAYCNPTDVTVTGNTLGYQRIDKADPAAEIHFCPNCGSTTHFTLTPNAIARFGNTMMGVNMALAAEQDLAGIELRYPDGLAWSGEGDFHYVRAPRVIGSCAKVSAAQLHMDTGPAPPGAGPAGFVKSLNRRRFGE